MSENITGGTTHLVEMDMSAEPLEEASVGETTIQVTDAKPVNWVECPDAMSMRAHIFNTPDLKEELIDVPEWRVRILVRGMTGKQRSRVLQGAMRPDGSPDLEKMYPDMVIASCYHPVDGKLIFNPADRKDLNEKAGGVLERLAMACARLSGLDQTQVDAIRKN